MDDLARLLRLLDMVSDNIREWARPHAQRKLDEFKQRPDPGSGAALEDKDDIEGAASRLAQMTLYISGARKWHASGGREGDPLDARQLPEFVLEGVTGLPDEVVALLGSWVVDSLATPKADVHDIGRLWADDSKATAWRLCVDRLD